MDQPHPLIRIHLRGASDVEAERNMVLSLIAAIEASPPAGAAAVRLTVVDPSFNPWKGDGPDTPWDPLVFDLLLGLVWMDLPEISDPSIPTEGDSEMEEDFMNFTRNYLLRPSHVLRHLYFKEGAPDRLLGKQKEVRRRVEALRNRIGASLATGFTDATELRMRLTEFLTNLMVQVATQVASKDFYASPATAVRPDPQWIRDAQGTAPTNYVERDYIPLDKLGSSSLDRIGDYHRLSAYFPKNRRAVILGPAGQGKSEELKTLARKILADNDKVVPIFKRFNNYKGEPLETFLPSGWNGIPDVALVFIFDGLDEINYQYFPEAIRAIEIFSQFHDESAVIVSCRSNFFDLPISGRSATLEGFTVLYLQDLSIEEVYRAAAKQFGKMEPFRDELQRYALEDLVTRPFFMQELFRVYQDKGKLLSRPDLFAHIINARLRLDIAHFANAHFVMADHKVEITYQLERVAFVMSMMGIYEISTAMVDEILFDRGGLKLVQFGTVFMRKDGDNDIWKFEHNNLQEYLAAKRLERFDDEQVVTAISLEQPPRVKASWFNILNFFLSLRRSQHVIDWLKANDPALLVRLDVPLPESERTAIFCDLFEQYTQRQQLLVSKHFTYAEIARFGDSPTVRIYLRNHIEQPKNHTSLLSALYVLGNCKVNFMERRATRQALDTVLAGHTENPAIISQAIRIYGLHAAPDHEKVKEIMGKFRDEVRGEIRKNLFVLIRQANVSDDYADFLIEGIQNPGNGDDQAWLFSLPYELTDAINSTRSYASVKQILDFSVHASHAYFMYSGLEETIFGHLIGLAVAEFEKVGQAVVADFIELASLVTERTILAQIVTFFHRTGTGIQLFDYLLHHQVPSDSKSELYFRLIREPLLIPIFEQLEAGRVTDEQFQEFLDTYCLGLEMEQQVVPEWFIEFISGVNAQMGKSFILRDYYGAGDHGDEWGYDPAINVLLFDESRLAGQINTILEAVAAEPDIKHALALYRGSDNARRESPTVRWMVRLLLRELEAGRPVTVERFKELFADEHTTTAFLLFQLALLASKEHPTPLEPAERDKLGKRCDALLQNIDIPTAYTRSEKGMVVFDERLRTIWKLFVGGYCQLKIAKALDFTTFVDSNSLSTPSPVAQLGNMMQKQMELLRARVQKNLQKGGLLPKAYYDNALFAFEHGPREVIPDALQKIMEDLACTDKAKVAALERYYRFSGDAEMLAAIAMEPSFEQVRWEVMDLLLKVPFHHPDLESYLLGLFEQATDVEEKLKAAKNLVYLGNARGQEYVAHYCSQASAVPLMLEQLVKAISHINNPAVLESLLALQLAYSKKTLLLPKEGVDGFIQTAVQRMVLAPGSDYADITGRIGRFRDKEAAELRGVFSKMLAKLEDSYVEKQSKAVTLQQAMNILGDYQNERKKDVSVKDKIL